MLETLFNLKKIDPIQPDGFYLEEDDSLHDCHLIISKYQRLVPDRYRWPRPIITQKTENEIEELLNLEPKVKVRVVMAATIRMATYLTEVKEHSRYPFTLRQLLTRLMRTNLPFTEPEIASVLRIISTETDTGMWYWPINSYLRQMDYFLDGKELTPLLRLSLTLIVNSFVGSGYYHASQHKKLIRELKKRLGFSIIEAGEIWTDTILATLDSIAGPEKDKWEALFLHASNAKAGKPNPKWLKKAEPLLDEIGRQTFQASLQTWLPLVEKDKNQVMSGGKAEVLKGLIWFCSFYDDNAIKRLLVDVALTCFHKIPQHGDRSQKVGNACIHVLCNLGAISELSQLRLRVRNRRTKNLISEALESAALDVGITTAELEEIAVPTYGLTGPGILEQEMGDFTAELRIEGNGTILKWRRANGKYQKSIPAAVKRDYPERLKDIKRTQKEIKKMLPAQRRRIENLLAAREASWNFDTWRERYLDHPLLAPIVRRLIWQFGQGKETILGIWYDGRLVDLDDRPLDRITAETTVRLWHPLGFDVDLVREWRAWLLFHEVRQPFKQAHREIYLLTDAELSTNTYSNRFAAHLLRQHQFNALCQERGWRYTLEGGWDSGYGGVPTLHCPGWGITAQFWVQGVHSDDWQNAYSPNGINLYISTDQVRFYDRHMEQMELADVPAQLFSEVLRDVDLFVGVCSIGNDPNWEDRGGLPGYGGYWQSYAFGNLSATAETRKELLQTLIPRLKIAHRCSFAGKFLVVEGQFRTYKIHLGSGNILMEPNDQYLCIVPDQRSAATKTAGKVFLPFDGDAATSIILSKAFLLADDDKISDPTIVRQIES